jgi:hypothetical protein
MVKCGALFEVRTELLNILKASVGFEGLIKCLVIQTSPSKLQLIQLMART